MSERKFRVLVGGGDHAPGEVSLREALLETLRELGLLGQGAGEEPLTVPPPDCAIVGKRPFERPEPAVTERLFACAECARLTAELQASTDALTDYSRALAEADSAKREAEAENRRLTQIIERGADWQQERAENARLREAGGSVAYLRERAEHEETRRDAARWLRRVGEVEAERDRLRAAVQQAIASLRGGVMLTTSAGEALRLLEETGETTGALPGMEE